jgi:hypothetical protein
MALDDGSGPLPRRAAAVDVELAAGVWGWGCDSVPLLAGDVDSGAIWTLVSLRTSSPQPTSPQGLKEALGDLSKLTQTRICGSSTSRIPAAPPQHR